MSNIAKRSMYHLVLGLPEDVTSPNHYELLGLDARTSDPQVIKNAAADQNRKLLAWQNSDRYAEVKALTLEIVHAKEVLLNDQSRAAYDAGLGDWGISSGEPWIIEEPRQETAPKPLSVRCPECEAEFKLRNRDLIGRRMPCPECGFRFTVRPARETAVRIAEIATGEPEDEAELAELDNFDDMPNLPRSRSSALAKKSQPDRDIFEVEAYEDDADAYENHNEYEDYESAGRTGSFSRDRTQGNRRSKPRSGSQASNEPAKWPIAVGGLLMAIGTVVLAGVFISQAFAPKISIRDRLSFLPPDSRAMGYVRVGDLARSPYFQDHLTRDDELRNRMHRFREQTGMELQEIESLSIALKRGRFDAMAQTDLKRNPGFPTEPFVAVARANKDWDRSKLIGDHTTSRTHQGETFHEFTPAGSNERWAVYLPDARTAVFGTAEEVKAAIETEGKAPDWPAMEYLEPDYPVVFVEMGETGGRDHPMPGSVGWIATGPGQIFGRGFFLENNQGKHVIFAKYDSAARAAAQIAAFERMKAKPSFAGSTASNVELLQHGDVVTAIESERNRLSFPGSEHSVFAPLSLLAQLGQSSSRATDSDPNSGRSILIPTGPNRPDPPRPESNATKPTGLDALIADLQEPQKAKQAAEKLAKMPPDPDRQREVTGHLENVVRTGDFWGKMKAVDALGVWGSSDNVPFLVGIFDGNDGSLKQQALEALGKIRDPRALPILIDSLGAGGSLQYHAKVGLKVYGSEAEPELLKRLAVDDFRIQIKLCEVLGEMGTERSLPQLDELAAGDQSTLKREAKSAADAIRNRKP